MIDNTIPRTDGEFFKYIEGRGYYRDTRNLVQSNEAKNVLLRECSAFGGLLFLEMIDGSIKQLSKKKVRWNTLCFFLFGNNPTAKQIKQLKMHGIAEIERR